MHVEPAQHARHHIDRQDAHRKLVGIGLALGLVISLAVSSAMARLLYDVRPTDAATLTSIAALTFLVALIASLVPAVRAVRVDPVTALRAE